jgi:hypothetical protein
MPGDFIFCFGHQQYFLLEVKVGQKVWQSLTQGIETAREFFSHTFSLFV